MSTMKQSALRADLERGQQEVDARVEELAADLSEAQIAWRPPEGGWGVGQIFEHLLLGAESYTPAFTRLIESGVPAASGDPEWRSTLLGGWLVKTLEKEGNRYPAPKIYRVGPAARPGVLAEFLAAERRVTDFRDRAAVLDWRRARVASPPLPFFHYNLGDAFRILVVHAARHLRQAGRVLTHPEFPR